MLKQALSLVSVQFYFNQLAVVHYTYFISSEFIPAILWVMRYTEWVDAAWILSWSWFPRLIDLLNTSDPVAHPRSLCCLKSRFTSSREQKPSCWNPGSEGLGGDCWKFSLLTDQQSVSEWLFRSRGVWHVTDRSCMKQGQSLSSLMGKSQRTRKPRSSDWVSSNGVPESFTPADISD